jgi:hypothetical protein
MAQEVGGLPSKCEALTSTLVTPTPNEGHGKEIHTEISFKISLYFSF